MQQEEEAVEERKRLKQADLHQPSPSTLPSSTSEEEATSEEADFTYRSPVSAHGSEPEVLESPNPSVMVPRRPQQPAGPPPDWLLAKAKAAPPPAQTQSPDITVSWNHRVAPLLPQMKSEAYPRGMVRPSILKCNPKAVPARPKPSMTPPPGVW